MFDSEKIIKGLTECVAAGLEKACPADCPYFLKCFPDVGLATPFVSLMTDAIALLKEQERKKGSWDYGTKCSVCKGTIIPPKDRKVRANFCPWCGADMRDSYEQEGR